MKQFLAAIRSHNWPEVSRAHDLKISLSMVIFSLFAVVLNGDYLYVGLWYYAVVLAIGVLLGAISSSRPLFVTGVVSAIDLTLLFYAYHNSSLREGMLVLGHLLSMSGAIVGILVSAGFIRKLEVVNGFAVFGFSIVGVLLGFSIAQFFVCNSLVSCGWMLV